MMETLLQIKCAVTVEEVAPETKEMTIKERLWMTAQLLIQLKSMLGIQSCDLVLKRTHVMVAQVLLPKINANVVRKE